MLGDDLVSIVSSALIEDEEEDEAPESDRELKFDPDAVKTELVEFDGDDGAIDDAFLRSINCEEDDNAAAEGDDAERQTSGGEDETRKSQRKRRRRIIDPLALDPDDANDDDWQTWGGSKGKKRNVTARTIKRDQAKKKERDAIRRRKAREGMTSEEKDKQREIWREEARRKRTLQRKQKEEENALRNLVDDGDLDSDNVGGMAALTEIKQEPKSDEEREENDGVQIYKRTRRRAASKINFSEKFELSDEEEYKPVKKSKPRQRKRKSEKKDGGGEYKPRRSGSRGQRKKVSEMTEEERERMKAKWREESRLKRARQRERMTPEEREEYLRIQRERRRMQRALQKVTMTEEEREEFNKKARERKKEKRSQMTPEEKRERAQRVTMRRIERLAQMTEEEKAQYRMNNYMSYMARLSRMSQEEIEQRRQKRREYTRKRLEKMTEEDRERRRQRIRQYRWNMDPDRKKRFLERLREGYKKRVERLKAEGKWDEVKERWRSQNKEKKILGTSAPPGPRRKRGPGTGKGGKPKQYPNETPEQRRERLRETRRKHQIRAKIKKKLAIQEMLDNGMSMEEINRQMETPEQRERRLMKCRINKAKLDLRKRLVSSGAPPEEIQVRLNELAATYQPSRNFRPYKPRPETWKPINPDDLKLLTEPTPPPPPPPPLPPQDPKPKAVKMVSVGNTTITGILVPESRLSLSSEQELKPDNVQYFNPEYAPSPAGASTCSYVSAAVTPEPLPLVHQNQQHFVLAQQFPQQSWGQQQYSQAHSHQQPQPLSQTVSLQHMIDNMNYQEVTTSQQQFVHPHSRPSMDYASSYDATSPPPASPSHSPKQDSYNSEYGGSSTYQSFAPSTSSTPNPESGDMSSYADTKRKRGRPRKGEPPVIKPPKKGTRRQIGVPTGALHKDVNRDAICDECGNAYNSIYLQEHKRNFHNPHYKNGQCTLCGEKFKQSRNFHTHYKKVHCEKKVPLPDEEKKHMCEDCGRAFHQFNNMKKHWFYMHGPGRLSENFHKCHLCPGEKFFKQKLTLLHHYKRKHPGYNPGVYKCCRCPESFPNETQLNSHVNEKHPEAYWPCQYCSSVKYSELGLKFHYSNGCLKIPREEWVKLRKEIGDNSIERLQIQCEFCDRIVGLMNLTRHYWEMHNVKEEKFTCPRCDKIFKRREYWGAHMVDQHNSQPDEWKEIIRKLNVGDRSKVQIMNLEGKQGGAPVNPMRKPEVEERLRQNGGKFLRKKRTRKSDGDGEEDEGETTEDDEEEEGGSKTKKEVKKRGRPKREYDGGKGKKKRGRPKRNEVESSDEEEDDEDEFDPNISEADRIKGKQKKGKTSWRSMDEDDSDVEYVPTGSTRRKSKSSGRKAEDDDDNDAGNKSKGESENDEKGQSKKCDEDELGNAAKPKEPVPGPSKNTGPAVPMSEVDLDSVVKTEMLSDEEDVQIAWIYKD